MTKVIRHLSTTHRHCFRISKDRKAITFYVMTIDKQAEKKGKMDFTWSLVATYKLIRKTKLAANKWSWEQ